MSVAIVDYGSGNLHSAAKAFERAARPTGQTITVTSDPDVVRRADRVVLPGVGHMPHHAAPDRVIAEIEELGRMANSE